MKNYDAPSSVLSVVANANEFHFINQSSNRLNTLNHPDGDDLNNTTYYEQQKHSFSGNNNSYKRDNYLVKQQPLPTFSIPPPPTHHQQLRYLSETCTLGSRSVGSILKDRVNEGMFIDGDAEDAFFVADLGELARQYAQWRELLPRIEPFYAVKCNPDPMVLKTMVDLGVNFDCASKAEIQAVIGLDVDPSRIIYANPCKQSSHIRFASSCGVTMMTFDNADELRKIKSIHPNAQAVLRILTDDSRSLCQLGIKFGAAMSTVPYLLRTAKELGINLVGVSFHVGSGCFDAAPFGEAVANARIVFDWASEMGFNLNLLDVGGGFPGNNADGITFPEIAKVLSPAIEKYFPSRSVRVIAEPGRYFVSSAFTLAVNIVARRIVPRDRAVDLQSPYDYNVVDQDNMDDHPKYMYYVNDGMYGSFNCITFDHAIVKAHVLKRGDHFSYNKPMVGEPKYTCSIWGPTCDSIDCIAKEENDLPELDVGDWLYFDKMGAYTICAASQFNGFKKSTIIYTNTEADIEEF